MTQRTWLLIGAAVVIVLAIWLFMGSGTETPTEPAADAPATEAPAAEGEAEPAEPAN